ncbi:MAG: hypothetical protein AB1941_11835 [Gemmatimonadota bacterium]
MPRIAEGSLSFDFPAGWEATKFDDWSFYQNQFKNLGGGSKGVDILALEPGAACLWQIEIKDYRRHRRTKTIDLAAEVVQKARDTLAALAAARVNANDAGEKALADAALHCRRLRIVLHLEQPTHHSKLFRRAIDPANVQLRLRQLAKAIDPHPMVREMGRMPGCPWTVT